MTSTPGRWHIGSGFDCVCRSVPRSNLRGSCFAYSGWPEGIDRLVEVGRREVGAEGVDRAEREGMRLAGRDEAHARCRRGCRLAAILLEDDAAKGKAGAHVVAQHGALRVVLVGLLDLGVADRASRRTPASTDSARRS